MIYENWASAEPSSPSDECAIIGDSVGSGYQWDDKSCNDQFGFMCQTGSSLEVMLSRSVPLHNNIQNTH